MADANEMTTLREARRRAGLTAEVLATRAGVSLGWIRVVERAPQLMSQELAGRLAAALGVNVSTLLGAAPGATRVMGIARRGVSGAR